MFAKKMIYIQISPSLWFTVKAYVLLNVDLDMGAVVTQKLADVNEIVNIYGVYGIYDYIIELEADSMDRIKDVALNKIRRLHNVRSSITLLTYGDSFINE